MIKKFLAWLKSIFGFKANPWLAWLAVAREAEQQEIAARCKDYQDTVNRRLAWNVENSHLYKPGKWAVVSVAYEKTSKGKVRNETHTLGVVLKDQAGQFIFDLSVMWANFVQRLLENEKPTPSIDMLDFASYDAYIGWRRGEHIIDDDDIEQKHGVIDVEKAFKQLKSL